MGRKSKLTEKQWARIGERFLAGESARSLGPEYGVSEAAIRQRFSSQHKKIKSVANQIIEAENAFKELPIASQIATQNLTAQLRSISDHLASAAQFGAMTAHRLSGIANAQVELVDDAEPEKSTEALQRIAVLTKIANGSSEIAVNLLRANKETVDDLNKGEDERAPAGLSHFYGEQ